MEWKSVINPNGGYSDGFNREAKLQFRRGFDGEVFEMRLSEQTAWYNVAGLQWLNPPSQKE